METPKAWEFIQLFDLEIKFLFVILSQREHSFAEKKSYKYSYKYPTYKKEKEKLHIIQHKHFSRIEVCWFTFVVASVL